MLPSIQTIHTIERIIFDITEDNIKQTVDLTLDLFENQFPDSFNLLVSQFLYSAFISKVCNKNLIINYLLILNSNEEEIFKTKNNIIYIFKHYLLQKTSQESYFLIANMIKQEILDASFVKNINSLYFAHYKTLEEILRMKDLKFYDEFISNLEILSKNDWKLHKMLIDEGVNPLIITKVLRNDNLEQLQEISSQKKFDFNQFIEPSLYEICSFVNKKYVSLIDYCAFYGSFKCFKYLLMNGSNVNNTLKYAIAGGNLEIIRLCEQNISLLSEDPIECFETAIEFHRNEIFYYFYEKNFDQIYDLTKLGRKCIDFSNYEIFSFLEKEGMEINDMIIKNIVTNGNTFLLKDYTQKNQIPNILIFAIPSGNLEIVQLLLEQEEIDINTKYEGETALIYASKYGQIEIVKFLLKQKNIDINVKDDFWRLTAFLWAILYNHIEIVKLFLEQKEINDTNDDVEGLMFASRYGRIDTVKFLIKQNKVDLNAKNNEGWTALMCASRHNQIEIVQFLFKQKDIDINAKDKDGWTALMHASRFGQFAVVEFLLEQKDIDINAKDKEGKTALMLASENGHIRIVNLLQSIQF